MEKITNTSLKILLTIFTLAAAFSAMALPTGTYARHSRLAEGHWVKIAVDTTGVYAIPHNRLTEWGFEHPERVAVFGTGPIEASSQSFATDMVDDLSPIASTHSGNKLIFYAEGDTRVTVTGTDKATFQRNFYDFNSYYFLAETEESQSEIPLIPFRETTPDFVPTKFSYGISVVEKEIQNPGVGGVYYHGPRLDPGQTERFVLEIEGLCPDTRGNSNVTLNYDYAAERNDSKQPSVTPVVTVDSKWTVKSTKNKSTSIHAKTRLYALNTGGNIVFTGSSDNRHVIAEFNVPANYQGNYFAVDRMSIIYPRTNRVGEKGWSVLNFISGSLRNNFAITDAPEDLILWEVTDPRAIRRFELSSTENATLASYPIAYSSDNPGRVLAFSPSADFPEPEFTEVVANQNLHASEVPDMLIVTTGSLRSEAENLAQIHRAEQGLDVLVVVQDQIFNEFSNGTRMPQGIHRFVKMLYDRDSDHSKFRYLLLYGGSLADNRFVTHTKSDMLVSFQAELLADAVSNTTNYCGDTYFAMLDDNYDHSVVSCQPTQISIGRLPVRTPQDGLSINAKINRYLTEPTAPSTSRRALFLSDKGDNDQHFDHSRQALELIRSSKPEMIFTSVDNLIYPLTKNIAVEGRRKVHESLMRGQAYFWYTGHGGPEMLTLNSRMWTKNDVERTANPTYPHALLATCDAFAFDEKPDGIAEEMIMKSDGGMIGAVAAGRAVFLDYNRQLNHEMAYQLGLAKAGDSFADVFRRARNSLVDTDPRPTQLGANILCYNYCGDPALPLPIAEYSIAIESVGGQSASESITIDPLAPAMVKARVVDEDGNTVAYNGHGILEVYANPYKLVSTIAESATEEKYIEVETDLLTEIPVNVVNGVIEARIVVPADCRIGDRNRLVISTRSDEDGTIALGSMHLSVGADIPDNPVSGAPVIEQMYIGSEDFANGDIVPSGSTLYAVVTSGESPVSTARRIGTASRCLIDGNTNVSADISTSYREDGSLLVSLTLPTLPDGRHTVSLSVGSITGERASADIDFTVMSAGLRLALSSDADRTVRDNVTFDIENLPVELSSMRLLITDDAGTTVRTVESPSFPYEWNLSDNNGTKVADGVYHAWVSARSGNTTGASDKVTFTIVRQ